MFIFVTSQFSKCISLVFVLLSKGQIGGAYICPFSLHVQVGNLYKCEIEMCFFAYPNSP